MLHNIQGGLSTMTDEFPDELAMEMGMFASSYN